MTNDSPGPTPPMINERRPPCEVAASLVLLTAAALALAAPAFFSTSVSSRDAQNLAPSIDANSAGKRAPEDETSPASGIIASLFAPPAVSFSQRPAASSSYAVDANGARIPLFFGFIEFDWDPDAPGGVPGFGPTPR